MKILSKRMVADDFLPDGTGISSAFPGSSKVQGRTVCRGIRTTAKSLCSALPFFQGLAKERDPEAQTILGVMHFKGQGVELDEARGIDYFRDAARQEFPAGQYRLAAALLKNREDNSSVEEAVMWFQRSAEAGYLPAQFTLGLLHSDSRPLGNFQPDTREAHRWFSKAAHGGMQERNTILDWRFFSSRGKWISKKRGTGYPSLPAMRMPSLIWDCMRITRPLSGAQGSAPMVWTGRSKRTCASPVQFGAQTLAKWCTRKRRRGYGVGERCCRAKPGPCPVYAGTYLREWTNPGNRHHRSGIVVPQSRRPGNGDGVCACSFTKGTGFLAITNKPPSCFIEPP